MCDIGSRVLGEVVELIVAELCEEVVGEDGGTGLLAGGGVYAQSHSQSLRQREYH